MPRDTPPPPSRAPRASERPSSRPVAAEFVAQVRRLWIQHDPMRFVVEGVEQPELYEHEAYVASLCADDILSEGDAARIVSTILRREFGSHGATWADPGLVQRIQALAGDLFRAIEQRAGRGSAPPTR